MPLKYEKPMIIPFNSEGQTGMGRCSNGTSELGGNCSTGVTPSGKCSLGTSATSSNCQDGTTPAAGKCTQGGTP